MNVFMFKTVSYTNRCLRSLIKHVFKYPADNYNMCTRVLHILCKEKFSADTRLYYLIHNMLPTKITSYLNKGTH